MAALVPQRFDDIAAHRACDVGQGLGLRPIGGQLHAISFVIAVTPDLQYAGLARAKAHLVPPLCRRQQDMPARQRCMAAQRSEEHTSELQSLMRISYAVFCLKKTKTNKN